MPTHRIIAFIFLVAVLCQCKSDDPESGPLELLKVRVGSSEIELDLISEGLPVDRNITLVFSSSVDRNSAENGISLSNAAGNVNLNFNFSSGDKEVILSPIGALENSTVYTISISNELMGVNGKSFTPREVSFETTFGPLELLSVRIDAVDIGTANRVTDIPVDLAIDFSFSTPINTLTFEADLSGPSAPSLSYTFSNENRDVKVTGFSPMKYLTRYEFEIDPSLTGEQNQEFGGYSLTIYSEVDPGLKFPEITDEELLTKVQEQTFKYFWDFGHPTSGLSRERNTSGSTVTSGGSGFGVMAIIVGIERGFITRQEGVDRLQTIVDFLGDDADRFHGAWSHWLNGSTGEVIPFSSNDDGGDLVETSYMAMGLLTARQYLDPGDPQENSIRNKITALWEAIEWDWYTQGENSLTWHWSPNFDFEKNHKIGGWNEALITYIMAAASPAHGISKAVYDNGWARNGNMVNGNSYYGITLPLGNTLGGPLFFEQYTFLGLDPRNLQDAYASYWEQVVNHTLINRAYCIANPLQYVGYSEQVWGLTASDNHMGYSAHSPTNDLGVITPTAALSSIAFTPDESMEALRYFYYILGDKLWGEYGFVDAFNITEGWYASSFLAIDQGPILIMIENHRTGLLWNLFMSDPDVQQGLTNLGFTY